MIEQFMLEAINLASLALDQTLPNPRVGAVVFDDEGKILGRGYHRVFGAPHAEVEAIEDAKGFNIKGASICVTLEPCNHTGKTPPCSEAIISSGIKNVYIGVRDDCRDIKGCGVEALQASGLKVVTGILEDECRDLNPGFHKFNSSGLPFIHLKIATSINGKIGNGKWFTSESAREKVHSFRASSDLILTGVGTIESDNPHFNSRLPHGSFPNRIVILDTNLRLFDRYLNRDLNIFKEGNRIIVVTLNREKADILRKSGIEVIDAKPNSEGLILLTDLIEVLSREYGFKEIFVEGGSRIMNSFLRMPHNYVDRLTMFIAPLWFDSRSSSFFDERYSFPNIEFTNTQLLGNTICVEGRLRCLQD